MKVNIQGLKENIAILKGYPEAVRPALNAAIKERMEAIFAESQSLVPVDTGELKNSGSVVLIEGGSKILYTADYAERIEYDFALKHKNGHAGFVMVPFARDQKVIKAELLDAAKKPLEK